MPLLLLPILSLALLVSLWPDDLPPDPRADIRPVALLPAASGGSVEGFDAARAARRVVQGAAARLDARGVSVRAGSQDGVFVVGEPPEGTDWAGRGALRTAATQGRSVTLSVGFGVGANPWASGSETLFGGNGDASWRLAARVQWHFVRGLWDVLGYDSYDRGVVEQGEKGVAGGGPAGLRAGDPWVTAYPLFATNPRERALLESPESLDLLSTALANAVCNYLDPSAYTPRRDPRLGWRRPESWQPVSPGVFTRADHGTRLALTFDGGASSEPTPAILKALRDAGVRATMFMTADFVERNPELVVQMARDGHEFGNHSSTHPDMTQLSAEAVVAELDRLESDVRALTGKSTRPWFRPPFGAYDDRLVQLAAEQGYHTILWTADSADWRDDVAAAAVQRRLLAYAAPGAILIEHLGSPQSAEVLPEVLRLLRERGFSFGTLSEVLGIP